MAGSTHSSCTSDDELEEAQWLLGFVEPPRKHSDLLRHRFPSKVGGRPAWLDPLHLPSEEQLTCRVTGKPMDFLLQVYAPVEDNPAAFHRTVLLFTSPDGGQLAAAGAVRALRCQLPRRNRFYAPEPPNKTDVRPPLLPEDDRRVALARDRWGVAEHEQRGGGGGQQQQQQQEEQQQQQQGGPAAPPPRLYPESELVVEPEADEGEDDSGSDSGSGGGGDAEGTGVRAKGRRGDDHVRRLVKQYKAAAEQGEGYSEEELPGSLVDELEHKVLIPEQRHFAGFQARIGREPSQCLRYCFDPAARPLWPSSKGIPGPADIPACERCGAPRRFEFQVLPQLIVHLGAPADDPSAPDWGTLAVYCCSTSCDSGGGGAAAVEESSYLEEFVWVQAMGF